LNNITNKNKQEKDIRENFRSFKDKDVDGSGWVTESSAVFENTLFGDNTPAKTILMSNDNYDKMNSKNNADSTQIRDNRQTQSQTQSQTETQSSQVAEKVIGKKCKRKLVNISNTCPDEYGLGGRDVVGATDGSRVRAGVQGGVRAGASGGEVRGALMRGAQSVGGRDGAYTDKGNGPSLSQSSLLSISPISTTQGRPPPIDPSHLNSHYSQDRMQSRPNVLSSKNKEKEASKRVSQRMCLLIEKMTVCRIFYHKDPYLCI
jgi:hypothetical protein